MQSLEFTRALQEITKDLKLRELLAVVAPWVSGGNQPIPDPQKNQFVALLFESNSGYSRLMERRATRKVLEQFTVSEFYDPARLGAILSAVSSFSQAHQIYGNIPMFKQFFTFTELIRWLLKVESAAKQLLESEKIGQVAFSEGIVQLELIEYSDEVGISPDRLRVFVSSVSELHTCLALILGLKNDKLVFRYFDSGSGFLVGVKCAKEVAEAMNALLSQWWDRMRFWRYDTFDRKIEAVSKTLSLVETVHQQVLKEVITSEEGENLKRRALVQVEKLTGIGASVPLADDASLDQRQLLAEMRETKLLGSGDTHNGVG